MVGSEVELRPVREPDFWIYERQAVDPAVTGHFNWSGFRDLAATRRRFAEDGLIGPDDGSLLVSVRGEAAGTVNWKRVSYGKPVWACWNIGIAMLPDFRGKGHGTTAQALLVRYLFDNHPLPRIEAYTDIDNVAEQRSLEKAGFQREGTIRSAQFREGRWRDLHLYAVIRN
jgi:RimJ/RimL family protein N-acetyltransferase